MSKTSTKNAGPEVVARNRRATFDYEIERRVEAGIVLVGTEVKSMRDGTVNISDAYAMPDRGELYLVNLNISPYKQSGPALNHVALRRRKLLVHRRELDELAEEFTEKGLSLIPLSIYFKEGRAKVELGVCRGRKKGDKRQAIAEREQKREVDRAMRGAGRRRRED